MNRVALATLLVEAPEDERSVLLEQHPLLCDLDLAYTLKTFYDDSESSDPQRASQAAAALHTYANASGQAEIRAVATWTAGMTALDAGQMEQALMHLDDAAAQFSALGKEHTRAETQVSKLIGLAMLGRYNEAIRTGLAARDTFLAYHNVLAAGKIEQNLGNIYFRQERHHEAQRFYAAARAKFTEVADQKLIAFSENGLANVLAQQHDFRAAAQLYQQALARVELLGLEVTQALIECNIGSLALFQGNYDHALDYLERSRRRYAALGMPHESAIAEQEIAEAYLELNLAPEAAAIYTRILPVFTELGMRAEHARALAYHGRALAFLGRADEARRTFSEARRLYAAEENAVGEAFVTISEGLLAYSQGDPSTAADYAAQAEQVFAAAGVWTRLLLAGWLRGEATRISGDGTAARQILTTVLADAEQQMVPQVAQRCLTSLGLLAISAGDVTQAETCFKQAISLVETLRAPLPAEEFRAAFVADKLTPYAEMVRLCLSDRDSARLAEALDYIERSRSRALVDMLGGALQWKSNPDDPVEAALLARLNELRSDLNWFYNQINRPPGGDTARGVDVIDDIHDVVREREAEVLEITRQLQQRVGVTQNGRLAHAVERLDLARLRRELGPQTALVEYFTLDDEILVFVVTDTDVSLIRDVGRVHQVEAALEQLRFQIDGLRYNAPRMRRHLHQLVTRTQRHLADLYDLLLKPVDDLIGSRRVVIVPHRSLHYVPFHALYDGNSYVIERREVCYAPSAHVLLHCLHRTVRPLQRALLVGVSDVHIPYVRDEVTTLASRFPAAVTLLDEQASLAEFHRHTENVDLLHLACHGHFRPDNPLFSSLRMSDGWLTVRDAYSLDLRCTLITLSACETGVSAIAPGDELIGLARGFLGAGAASLLVSQWTVDDATTATLMDLFYAELQAEKTPAAALRSAQCALLREHPHPYFWSPFTLIGRW